MIEFDENTKKTRKGNIVVYDIDYLLDNLAREVYLLESYRQHRTHPVKFTEEDVALIMTDENSTPKKGEV